MTPPKVTFHLNNQDYSMTLFLKRSYDHRPCVGDRYMLPGILFDVESIMVGPCGEFFCYTKYPIRGEAYIKSLIERGWTETTTAVPA